MGRKFSVDPVVFEKFPGLHLGLVVAKKVDNSGASEKIMDRIRAEEGRIRGEFGGVDVLQRNPRVLAWREAYKKFGADPKKNRCSVENLYRLILNGTEIRQISPLVDIYNFISLKHMLPVGGEDIDRVTGSIRLCIAGQSEPPVLLIGEKDARPPHAGEVIYRDEVSAICRRFNWREADRTKLAQETKNCILVMEAIPPATLEEVEAATKELAQLIRENCGGAAEPAILDHAKAEVEF